MKPGKTKNSEFDYLNSVKDMLEIPKQYFRVPKSYSKNSPLRNKQNLLKARIKNYSFSGANESLGKSVKNSMLDQYYNKIFIADEKENSSFRHFSVKKQRILAELPEKILSNSRLEQIDAINDYKLTQSKILNMTKCKLPPSIIKYKPKILF
jgi:hypothetical protein